jgi:ABC-type phosphate/phosphonate transport system substrate-binding protein
VTHPDVHGAELAALGMYPFPTLRPAWERLFMAVAERVRSKGIVAPAGLRWDLDPHETWLHPGLVLGMTCGWPLVTALREHVRVVGTFAYRGEPAPEPHLYRTLIVAREGSSLSEVAGGRAAINADDSLSGNISLLEVFGSGDAWDGPVVHTGAHLASIAAVRSGAADVASIDGMTWAYQQRDDPASLAGLEVLARGPWVPGLPVILPGAASDQALEEWRAAFAEGTQDPALVDTLDELMIDAFVPLDLADYDLALDRLRRRGRR